ncbi:DUF4328 domain-containing protein [Streptomyces sp. NBC_00820]|uniref:DUF4328 domain-containing protein n=1 Tax=Streptomyces sp. NBC_00820 TaxID=2975842 RepID=UPI002ED2FD16|nr:DUF4328 domain-containing protein [Streptomyces sp. NBC_00820]
MICARCDHYAAVPGSELCAQCAPASAGAAAVPAQPSGTQPLTAPPFTAPPFAAAPGAWLRSPVGLGQATAVLLGVVVAADLFAIWADLTQIDVTGDLADGVTGAAVLRRADRADTLYSASGVAQTCALIATMVMYLCWFYRVRVNAEVFDASAHSKTRGWAIAGWFVPVVNLWFPRRVTLDVWDASAPSGRRPGHVLVNSWWTLWLVSLLADRASARQYASAHEADELREAARQMMFSDMADIAAALLAVLVVLKLTRMQHEKALAGSAPDPAAG